MSTNYKPPALGAVSRVTVQVKPPKDRLIKDFTLNWRPNSDIVYVFETEPSGYFGPILGMYEKQTVTHNKMFLYRQVWKRNGRHIAFFFSAVSFPDSESNVFLVAYAIFETLEAHPVCACDALLVAYVILRRWRRDLCVHARATTLLLGFSCVRCESVASSMVAVAPTWNAPSSLATLLRSLNLFLFSFSFARFR